MAKFKTRARALDMLGRQQIAGIPTAINELFKNAYDAYAKNVQADYYRTHNLFILSDDGIGMTLGDFENKWLALGTDSKFNKNEKDLYVPENMNKRPVLGEKGIGRLAISTIGPQVLILTNSQKNSNNEGIVMSYIHWGLFELPGINIDDIDIPIKQYKSGEYPTNIEVIELINKYEENINRISNQLPNTSFDSIIKDLDEAKQVLQVELWNEMLKEFSLKNSSGTQFFVPTADKELDVLLKDYDRPDECSNLIKYLSGFFNTMTKTQDEIEMDIVFNDHKQIDATENVVESAWFWKPDDFEKADIYISGEFNDNGFFSGELRYGNVKKAYNVNCNSSTQKISCSGFKFTMGYIPGLKDRSSLSELEHKEYYKRAQGIGGIYIYRNNIRILPYGIPEFDFLQLERVRTLRAADFWFSHRRIFGTVELTEQNSNLQEKAGREGFKEGRAYRDFKAVLLTLLTNIMQDLKTDADLSKEDKNRKNKAEEIKKQKKAFEAQEKLNKKLLKEFSAQIKYLSSIINTEYANAIENAVRKAEVSKQRISESTDNYYKYKGYNDLIDDLHAEFNSIYKQYCIQKPTGIALNKNLELAFDSYNTTLEECHFKAYARFNQFSISLKDSINILKLYIDQKQYIKEKIKIINNKIFETEKLKQKLLSDLNNKFEDILQNIIEKSFEKYLSEINKIKQELAYAEEHLYDENISIDSNNISNYEQNVENIKDHYIKLCSLLEKNLDNMFNYSDTEKELYTLSDREEYYQSQLQAYKDSFEMDFDLVQRGLAIDIINHEFAKEVRTIRYNINRLKKWSEYNENILDIYQNIYSGFTHLDNYLGLFTQMQRRLYKEPMEITGRKINNHIEAVFKDKFDEYNICLKTSQQFLNHIITAYPSTIFPVFVNLVDNAIFWIKDRERREIIFDIDNNNNYIIQDSGPGISRNDEFVIFERGFSRKELGRGLGLYICKEALKKEGFDIRVDNPGEKGARFIIYKTDLLEK